jgi:hypothetical protein
MTPSTQTPLPSATEVKNTVGEKVSNSSLFGKISQIGKRVVAALLLRKTGFRKSKWSTKRRLLDGCIRRFCSNDNSKVQIIDKRTPIAEQPADISATQQLTSDTQATTDTEQVIPANPPQPDELVQTARELDAAADTQAVEPCDY